MNNNTYNRRTEASKRASPTINKSLPVCKKINEIAKEWEKEYGIIKADKDNRGFYLFYHDIIDYSNHIHLFPGNWNDGVVSVKIDNKHYPIYQDVCCKNSPEAKDLATSIFNNSNYSLIDKKDIYGNLYTLKNIPLPLIKTRLHKNNNINMKCKRNRKRTATSSNRFIPIRNRSSKNSSMSNSRRSKTSRTSRISVNG
jgi:hypothetical protein